MKAGSKIFVTRTSSWKTSKSWDIYFNITGELLDAKTQQEFIDLQTKNNTLTEQIKKEELPWMYIYVDGIKKILIHW